MKLIASMIVDTAATRLQKTIARLRVRKPQPWQCNHRWEPCPVVTLGVAGRHCTRCTALETRCAGQPIGHPESMAILLPQVMENALAAIDAETWPEEVA